MNDRNFLSREAMRDISSSVLAHATADETRVNVASNADGNTRFAVNQITTGGDVSNARVTVTSAFGRKVASSTTNRLDDDALRGVVETSERLARLAPEDPEYLGEVDPREHPDVASLFASTVELGPQERAAAVRPVLDAAERRDLESSGFLVHRSGSGAVANSRGLFAYTASSAVDFTTTARTPDGTGSGWAGTSVQDWHDLRSDALGEVAADKALRSRNPRPVEPGRWTVVMDPAAVANVVGLMMGQLQARAADEGRSFFARPGGRNRIGETFLDRRVTIFSDPEDPRIFSAPFDAEGLENRRTVWVEEGVLRNLVYDRFWAERTGNEPTGFPSGYHMAGGSETIEDMIRSTARGLWVTRFWYIRSVDPRTLAFTGLTRDGTFLIEDGRVTHPVQNLRWNETPIFVLNNIEQMGAPARVSSGLGAGIWAPPLKVRDFSFTSVSDAV